MSASDDDANATAGDDAINAVAVLGLAAQPVVWTSLYFVATTGGGLPAGPFGLLGLLEGLSYVAIVGLVGSALLSRATTPEQSARRGLLRLAQNLSLISVAVGSGSLRILWRAPRVACQTRCRLPTIATSSRYATDHRRNAALDVFLPANSVNMRTRDPPKAISWVADCIRVL